MFSSKKIHERITYYVGILQRFADRLWYPPLIGTLAALDNFIVVVPTDGILISSSMLTPRRWFWLGMIVSLGSAIGALVLAAFVEWHGVPWIQAMYPGVTETTAWSWTDRFFNEYGLYVVFLVAVSPLMQQPAVILASLAGTPLVELAGVIFTGRTIKYLLMAYLGSHAPKVLAKFWGLRGELEDAGVKLR